MENKTFQIEKEQQYLKDTIAEMRSWGCNKVADLLAEELDEELA